MQAVTEELDPLHAWTLEGGSDLQEDLDEILRRGKWPVDGLGGSRGSPSPEPDAACGRPSEASTL